MNEGERPPRRGVLARLEHRLAAVIRGVTIAAGVSIFLMMAQVTADVAMRYAFGSGIPGTLTVVSYYYMVIVAFVPLAYAELRRAHIQMELLTDLMPWRLSRRIQGWLLIPTGAVTAALTVRGLEEFIKQMQLGTSQVQGLTSIETWPATFALPLGTGLMTLLVLLRFVEFLTGADQSAVAAEGRSAQ